MNKGFTLIELLAVIVILAIIALIATPIVLSIINDTRTSAVIRSAEFYISAVENSIMQYNMKSFNVLTPKQCIIQSTGNVKCDGIELEVEVEGEKPTSGVITFDKGNLKYIEGINFGDGIISSGFNSEFITSDYRKICVAATNKTKTTGNIPNGQFKIGDEYICEVKPGTEYHFFVLSVSGDKVNLILDRNINSDGTLSTAAARKTESSIYNVESWIRLEDYVEAGGNSSNFGQVGSVNRGPVTALKFLNNATLNWANIENLNETYEDEVANDSGAQGTEGYGRISLNGKARMPKYSEVTSAGCAFINSGGLNAGRGSCPIWLVNYLEISSSVKTANYPSATTENFSGVRGYWILASKTDTSAWYVYAFNGAITYTDSYTEDSSQKRGIRPVISIAKNNLFQE